MQSMPEMRHTSGYGPRKPRVILLHRANNLAERGNAAAAMTTMVVDMMLCQSLDHGQAVADALMQCTDR